MGVNPEKSANPPAARGGAPQVVVKRQLAGQQYLDRALAILVRILFGKKGSQSSEGSHAGRETVESVVVAVILAFLFRAFVAEAFVIPTGSMAPTLQGRHVDVVCRQCGYQYRTGASRENEVTFHSAYNLVTSSTCPICRYTMELNRSRPGTAFFRLGNEDSFNGDRILVSKFTYQLGQPKRWDVIVFKYPGNAKQNYIKRLIGLPGEKIMIWQGDIYALSPEQRQQPASRQRYEIARKPPDKVKSMLQLVDDTRHIGSRLREIGWPSRWQQQSASRDAASWQISSDGAEFRVDAQELSWLRYHHLVPSPEDWDAIERNGRLPERLDDYRGQLILDYYAYNDALPERDASSRSGTSWVGDLAVECDVVVESGAGELLLKLVEGGRHYECRINVADGRATLAIDDGRQEFTGSDGGRHTAPAGQTKVRAGGSYHLRFANVDDQLSLWVDERLIDFDGPTTFQSPEPLRPQWSLEDPHDLAPLGIGGRNVKLHVKRLRVLRDIYYLALESSHPKSEYERSYLSMSDLMRVAASPEEWSSSDLFTTRHQAFFELEQFPDNPAADQFFPLGDNSPQSKDARLWSRPGLGEYGYDDPPPYVERKYLIGKALLIYWPHHWRPFWPNFARMGLIR